MSDLRIAKWILNKEARRDSQGRLRVYKLPSGDGGGTFEVAGINDRYHPAAAKRLKRLIESGQYTKAESEATDYIDDYTSGPKQWTDVLSIQFFLRDSFFNRGIRGAAAILQLTLNKLEYQLDVDGKVGPITKAALSDSLTQYPQGTIVNSLRWAREKYERSIYPWKPNARDESSKFWKGLVNRWNAAKEYALSLISVN